VSLHHVSIETRRSDVEAAQAFWALLGFERVEPPTGLADVATWMERDGTQVHLLYAEEPAVPREGHVAVVADDFDAAMERLRAAGHEPEPRIAYWGAARAFVRAPGGHLVEVMAAPP
jgi:catechol 2,3-dioxygenase-like lactoylglutathione lyase family enzyme